jgi:hypothetical protein
VSLHLTIAAAGADGDGGGEEKVSKLNKKNLFYLSHLLN